MNTDHQRVLFRIAAKWPQIQKYPSAVDVKDIQADTTSTIKVQAIEIMTMIYKELGRLAMIILEMIGTTGIIITITLNIYST